MKKPFKTWRTKDADKLKELVKSFNKKRAFFDDAVSPQPPKIKYSELLKDIHSREEYKRVISVYSRYLKPGAERPYRNTQGLKITQWEKNEMHYATIRINNSRKKQLEKLNVSSYKGSMGLIEANNLLPKTDFTRTFSNDRTKFHKYWKSAQYQANVNYWQFGEQRYKDNYIKAIRQELNGSKRFKTLLFKLKKLSGAQLLEFAADNPILQLEFIYELNLSFDEKAEYIIDHLESYEQ